MSQKKRRAVVIAMAGSMTLALIVGVPAIVRAFNPQPDPPGRWGMVGLARGQTARLNVVNLADPPGEFPPDPCMVMLTFLDSSGRMFMDRAGNEVMSEAMLLPGQAAFLDLPAADVFQKRGGRRVQFRAGLQPDSERGGTAGEMNSCSDLVGTLEVFDNSTGQTMVLYHPPDHLMGLEAPTEVVPGRTP